MVDEFSGVSRRTIGCFFVIAGNYAADGITVWGVRVGDEWDESIEFERAAEESVGEGPIG